MGSQIVWHSWATSLQDVTALNHKHLKISHDFVLPDSSRTQQSDVFAPHGTEITQWYLTGEESDLEDTNRPGVGRDDLKIGFCQATHTFHVISKSLHIVCSAQYLDSLYGSSGLPASKQKWIAIERLSTELASLYSIAQSTHRLICIKHNDKWAPPCNRRNGGRSQLYCNYFAVLLLSFFLLLGFLFYMYVFGI